jgi:hypothetical protein
MDGADIALAVKAVEATTADLAERLITKTAVGNLAAAVVDTTPMLQETIKRRSVAKQTTLQQQGQVKTIPRLRTAAAGHHMVVAAAVAQHMAVVAAVDIRAAANTGRY